MEGGLPGVDFLMSQKPVECGEQLGVENYVREERNEKKRRPESCLLFFPQEPRADFFGPRSDVTM